MILSWWVRSRRASPRSPSAVHAFTIVLRYVALRLRGRRHEFFVVRYLFCGCLVIPPSRKSLVQFCLVFSASEDKQRVHHELTSFMHRLVNALEHTLECADYSGVKVESLQNLQDLLSTARRTALFSVCSCSPFAEVAHENFCLVGGLKDSSMSYPQSRTTKCAERYSTNPSTLPGSSSFVLHCAEIVCKLEGPFSVLRCHQWNTLAQ